MPNRRLGPFGVVARERRTRTAAGRTSPSTTARPGLISIDRDSHEVGDFAGLPLLAILFGREVTSRTDGCRAAPPPRVASGEGVVGRAPCVHVDAGRIIPNRAVRPYRWLDSAGIVRVDPERPEPSHPEIASTGGASRDRIKGRHVSDCINDGWMRSLRVASCPGKLSGRRRPPGARSPIRRPRRSGLGPACAPPRRRPPE
jgi:hypothetical protein